MQTSSGDGVVAIAPEKVASSTSTVHSGSFNLFNLPVGRKWDENSTEYKSRESALTKLFATTELSTRVVMYEEFKNFCCALDPKFQLPGAVNKTKYTKCIK